MTDIITTKEHPFVFLTSEREMFPLLDRSRFEQLVSIVRESFSLAERDLASPCIIIKATLSGFETCGGLLYDSEGNAYDSDGNVIRPEIQEQEGGSL